MAIQTGNGGTSFGQPGAHVGTNHSTNHTTGNNNPTGVEVRRTSKREADADTLPFWPYFVIKDLFALAVILVVFIAVVGFMPNYLGHPDNYIEANPLVTPPHIVLRTFPFSLRQNAVLCKLLRHFAGM